MKAMEEVPKFQTSHAILLKGGRYVMQLRDDIPTIATPGEWSLFGGMIQEGESTIECIRREIKEELSIEPERYRQLWYMDYYAEFEQTRVRTWFFEADISRVWAGHVLHEGQDAKAFTFEEIGELKVPSVMRKVIERYQKEER